MGYASAPLRVAPKDYAAAFEHLYRRSFELVDDRDWLTREPRM